MEEEKSNGGRYKRAFGYSPEDEEGLKKIVESMEKILFTGTV